VGGGVGDEQWQVAGSAAQVYERELVPTIFGPWAPRVLALADPAAGERVVCCQLGLQFFPDRAAALAEMARVLVPGGRLAAMVWRSIDHSPGFEVLAEALDRRIEAAGALMRAPFGLSDEGALRGLVEGAGFRGVELDRQAGVVRFGSARALVVAYGAGSPLAGPIGAAGLAARAGLVAAVQAALDPWQGAAGLAFLIEALLVSGRR
jgi:SAM-dependent methyltransferase